MVKSLFFKVLPAAGTGLDLASNPPSAKLAGARRKLPLARLARLELGVPGVALRRWREQVLITRLIVGDRMLERAERGGPEVHAIQILAQPLEGFDQVTDNLVFCRFRHCYCSFVRQRTFPLPGDKKLLALWFPDWQRRICESCQQFGTLFHLNSFWIFVPTVRI